MIRLRFIIFCVSLLLLLAACDEQQPQVEENAPVSREMKVVVPASVAGKWKSVKIALRDLQKGTEAIYQVDIGGSFQVPGTGLRVTVENFLPDFSENGSRATSMSNRPTNPAVQIVVREGEKEIHRGWLFANYPDRHRFENPRYKFVLLDYRPTG